MSLPKPNLDNKTFEQLVEEARKFVPGYSSEWTDYNPSDPGITLIDLLAWLSEIALYRTNLITDKHRLKYLQLLGVKPQPPKQAKVDLTFSSDKEKLLLKGTQVTTEVNGKKICFQLDEDINIVPGTFLYDNREPESITEEDENKIPKNTTLKKIVVDDIKSGIYDRSISNEKGDLFFAPFGEDIQKGCSFYLGFEFKDNLAPDTLSFMCYLYEEGLIEPGKHGTEQDYKFKNASLKWEISVKPKFCKLKNIKWSLSRKLHLKRTKLYTVPKKLTFNLQQIHDTADKWKWKTVLPEDKTEGFKKSGRIIFEGLVGWIRCNPFPELITSSKPCFWLRCRVEESHYEYPPRIEMLRLNTVSATHSLTVRDDNEDKDKDEKRVSNGLPGQVFKLKKTPILDKTLKLLIEEWVEVDDFTKSGPSDKHFVLDNKKGEIKLGDGKNGLIPPSGSTIMILIYASEDEEEGELIYDEWVSNGLPNQIFKLLKLSVEGEEWTEVDDFKRSCPFDKHFLLDNEKGIIKFGDGKQGLVPPVGSAITIMILKYSSEDGKKGNLVCNKLVITDSSDLVFSLKPLIQDLNLKLGDKWIEVDDFEGSGPSDKHFVLDNEKGELKFGDGLMGTVPPAGSDIEILEYVSGGGEEGNLMPECSWNIKDYNGKITNCKASTGGKKAQTIEEAIDDFCRDLKTPYTAVTLQDFEQIAKNTPGLRVARAKAIPNYKPGNSEPRNPEENRGSVTVVVIPHTPLEFLKTPPEPSEGFKHAVCQHLNEHRLLGTDIYVIPPKYVKVTISATIVPVDSFRDDNSISENVREKLNTFLHPIKGGLEKKGWPIGRDVYLSELHDLIENIEGVNCVIRLSISGDRETYTDSDGNLMLNSIAGVVYSGVHRVEIIRDTNQYYNKRG